MQDRYYEREKNEMHIKCCLENLKRRIHLKDLIVSIEIWIIFRWVLEKKDVNLIELAWNRIKCLDL